MFLLQRSDTKSTLGAATPARESVTALASSHCGWAFPGRQARCDDLSLCAFTFEQSLLNVQLLAFLERPFL